MHFSVTPLTLKIPSQTAQIEVPMDFGDAVRTLKLGRKVARSGWNGKDMFLFPVPDSRSATAGKTSQRILSETAVKYADVLKRLAKK